MLVQSKQGLAVLVHVWNTWTTDGLGGVASILENLQGYTLLSAWTGQLQQVVERSSHLDEIE
jgi:hypothetical protein